MTLAVEPVSRNAADAGLGFAGASDVPAQALDDAALVERLREPLRRALLGSRWCASRIESRPSVGEIVVRITGPHACLQLSFGRDEAEPGYVTGVVRDAVARFGA